LTFSATTWKNTSKLILWAKKGVSSFSVNV
jgi:hypothetical protein